MKPFNRDEHVLHPACYWGGCLANKEDSSGVEVYAVKQIHIPCNKHLLEYIDSGWNRVCELKDIIF